MSDIRVDPVALPEVASVSVPMPPELPARLPVRAEAASLWGSATPGFFDDRRAREVGDILTITIEIDDQASLSNESDRQRSGGASIGTPRMLGLERILAQLAGEGDGLVDLDAQTRSGGEGSIDRAESIDLTVAATVVQALPNGNLVIAGRQEVMVNAELRELRIAGIIRPEDILHGNTIPYDRIAEARITYGGHGQLSRQVRTGYGETALDVVLPY
ncbi:flagellar basal body L-ring protein FlgH [Jannaschia sp. Os4]|uniref:flagellar basal body L-ring protein FlgH n=1 Tax=Jannaschia sp. Os4 TaxID=2807617 RepID=UPI0031B5B324